MPMIPRSAAKRYNDQAQSAVDWRYSGQLKPSLATTCTMIHQKAQPDQPTRLIYVTTVMSLMIGVQGAGPAYSKDPDRAPSDDAVSKPMHTIAPGLLDQPLYTFTEDQVDQYLKYLQATESDLQARVIHLARKNIGQPYELYLLGEFPFESHDPDPIYCLDKSDCVVFSEHMYAMALSDDWWSFLANLQRIRYRDGEVGMVTRNHYTIADWDRNNRFLFEDITAEVGGDAAVKLTQICRRSRFFAKFGIGQDIPDEPISDTYIPKDKVPAILSKLRAADFVNIIRGDEQSQWAGHVGLIAIDKDGTVNFLHSAGKAVREQPLVEYLQNDRRCVGVKFLRLRDNAEQLMAEAVRSSPQRTDISQAGLNAALQRRWDEAPATAKPVRLDWRRAMRLQAYRITPDAPTDDRLQSDLERIDRQIGEKHGIPGDQRAFGVLDLNDQRLAMVRPDEMFYAASVPKICILLGYFETHPEAVTDLPDDVRRELGAMIKRSDNALAAKYGEMVGIEKIQEILQSKKYRLYDEKHGGGLWYGKHYGKGSPRIGDPVHDHSHGATVRQVLRFYLMMEQGRLVSARASMVMREIFAAPELEHLDAKFVAGLAGRKVSLIRKSGTWETWRLDTARVEHGDRVYLIVGMVNHENGDKYLANMAAAVDGLLCNEE